MWRSCTSLWIVLAAAPVSSLQLWQQPLLSLDDHEELDKVIDKWDEEQLITYLTNWSPSPELVSAWSKAWELEQAGDSKDKITREAMGAAVEGCKNLTRQRVTYGRMKDVGQHKGGNWCADPWFETRNCTESYHIPGYRLGDLVTGNGGGSYLSGYVSKLWPESIAAKFLKKNPKYKKLSKDQKYTELHNLINGPDYAGYERPSASDLVVHVRAFDVLNMCGGAKRVWSDKPKCGGYKRDLIKGQKYWQGVINAQDWSNINRVILFTGDHMTPSTSMTPATETDEYIRRISELFANKTGLSIELRKNGNADCDFVYMASAGPNNLIHSGGGYDTLIVEMVKRGSTQSGTSRQQVGTQAGRNGVQVESSAGLVSGNASGTAAEIPESETKTELLVSGNAPGTAAEIPENETKTEEAEKTHGLAMPPLPAGALE